MTKLAGQEDTNPRPRAFVKPLAWIHSKASDLFYERWEVSTPFGTYRIANKPSGYGWYCDGRTGEATVPTLEGAMAGANGHYEGLVWDLINPPSSGQPVAVVGSGFQLLWASARPLADIVGSTGLKPGDNLYLEGGAWKEAALAQQVRYLSDRLVQSEAELKETRAQIRRLRSRGHVESWG